MLDCRLALSDSKSSMYMYQWAYSSFSDKAQREGTEIIDLPEIVNTLHLHVRHKIILDSYPSISQNWGGTEAFYFYTTWVAVGQLHVHVHVATRQYG